MASRNRRSPRGWLCFILVVALGRTSEAQTPIPDCGNDTACLALYERASQESKQGNLAEAVRLYKLAYEVRADPKLLFSIARLLHRLDRKQEAIVYYRQFIDSPLDYAEQKRKAEQYLEQARQGTRTTSPALPSPPVATNQPPMPSQSIVEPTTTAAVPSAPLPANQQPPPPPSGATVPTFVPAPAPPLPTPTIAIPSQANKTPPTPVPTPSPPLPASPQALPSLLSVMPKVPSDAAPAKRPRWRLIAGGAAIGAGLILTGFGGSALAAQGKCIDIPTEPAQTCDEVFATTPIGGALLGTGAAVVIGGIVLMAWP